MCGTFELELIRECIILKCATHGEPHANRKRMIFTEGNLFHIYNRGNNRETVFYTHANYIYFLRKIKKYIKPHCDILSYCLMPNHFNLLIYANQNTVKKNLKDKNLLSEGFRHLLSSYAKAINIQENRVGSLFTQNTHSKIISNKTNQALTCLMYIHQNPVRCGLVKNMGNWLYSSYRDYCGLRNGTICNRDLAFELLDLKIENFYPQSWLISKDDLKSIF